MRLFMRRCLFPLAMLLPASAAEEGFEVLFDGKDLSSWTDSKGGEPGAGWAIEDCALVRKAQAGDLYSAKEYSDFDFRFEWKISAAGNSGVKYRVAKFDGRLLGPEYQILDDARHPDGKVGPQRQTAALYDILAPVKEKLSVKPVGEWNESRIVCEGPVLRHYLNGELVVEIDTSGQSFADHVKKSKFKDLEGFGKQLSGRIMLQDHMDAVWFRNLRIKPLPAEAGAKP